MVEKLNYSAPSTGFALNKGSYMIIRGDTLSAIVPVAEVTDHDGRDFVVRQVDEGDIILSFDFTLAWITVRTYAAVHAAVFSSWARVALLNEDISVTSATGFAHEHLFIPREDATYALEVLHHVTDAFRMREMMLTVLHTAGLTKSPASPDLAAVAHDVLVYSIGPGAGINPAPAAAILLLHRISAQHALSAEQRAECLTLEASLRDEVHAPPPLREGLSREGF